MRPPYFPTLFFVSYVIIVYFSRCCWRESSCMFQNAQGSVAQQTQIQCLTNHPNQWETREIGMVSPCLHPLSSLQHALVIIGQPMWSSRGTGCNLNQSYFTPREKQKKGKFLGGKFARKKKYVIGLSGKCLCIEGSGWLNKWYTNYQ